MSVLYIVLEAPTKPIVPESVIERDVGLIGRLPLQVRVGVVDRYETDDRRLAEHVARARIRRQSDQRCVGRDTSISESAPSCAQPQLTEWALRNEARLTETPRTRNCREHSPLVPLAELRRTVTSPGAGQEVRLLVAPVGFGEESNQTTLLEIRRRRDELGASAQAVEAQSVGEEALCLGDELRPRIVVVLVTAEYVE